MELQHKIKLAIGDWSNDGHGHCYYYRFYSSHSPEEFRRAYYSSEELTSITFRHDYDNKFIEPIASEYECFQLTDEQIDVLQKFGYDTEKLKLEEDDDTYCVDPDRMKDLIMWFVSLSLDGFSYKEWVDDFESIEQYGAGNFCHQFGYGCF